MQRWSKSKIKVYVSYCRCPSPLSPPSFQNSFHPCRHTHTHTHTHTGRRSRLPSKGSREKIYGWWHLGALQWTSDSPDGRASPCSLSTPNHHASLLNTDWVVFFFQTPNTWYLFQHHFSNSPKPTRCPMIQFSFTIHLELKCDPHKLKGSFLQVYSTLEASHKSQASHISDRPAII